MKVKILNNDLIRRYGGSTVEMNFNTAVRLEREGKVKFIEEVVNYSFPDSDNDSVIIFEEEKTVLESNFKLEPKVKKEETIEKPKIMKRIPAPDEPIFPQIKVGGNKQ